MAVGVGIVLPIVYWATFPFTYSGDTNLFVVLIYVGATEVVLVAIWLLLWMVTRKLHAKKKRP